MASTTQFGLPLLASAQAQKHVTVNEGLARLDAAAQLRVVSSELAAPPPTPLDGTAYLVPSGATGAWSGQADRIAVAANGGWVYLSPRAGWRLWDESAADWHMFDGTGWVGGAIVVSSGGAATLNRIVEIDHSLVAGPTSIVADAIPSSAQIVGVTARVTADITGGATTWRLGVAGADNRYGSGLGLAKDSYALGLSGSPVTYYSVTDLLITGEGGDLAGGAIRLAIHLSELLPPRPA